MVGVPGRSRGCMTCRKKKKGCDMKRPSCTRCLERNVTCGGYDQDHLWIASRYERRGCEPSAATLHMPTSPIMALSLKRTAWNAKGMEVCAELFPTLQDTQKNSPRTFIESSSLLTDMSSGKGAFHEMTSAIGLVTMGKGANDEAMLFMGRQTYGKALKELGRSLQIPCQQSVEVSLATVRLMGVYEMLCGADDGARISVDGQIWILHSPQAQNWIAHVQGELALILTHGPEAFTTDAAHRMFTLARYNALCISLRSRTPTVFNEDHWKTTPWRHIIKPPHEQIVDILLELPGLFWKQDDLDHTIGQSEQHDVSCAHILAECLRIQQNLYTWNATNAFFVQTADTNEPIPIEFPDMAIALTSTRYWMAALLLDQSFVRISRLLPHPNHLLPVDDRQFARLIVRSVPWFFKGNHGFMGSLHIVFPLSIALQSMRQSAVPDYKFLDIVFKAWADPGWPSSIKHFLRNFGNAIKLPAPIAPRKHVPRLISEVDAIVDIDGNAMGGPFVNASRF